MSPIIVSALFCDHDLHWLDALRRAHFPPERNQLSAHLTLFHHLTPSIAHELKWRLSEMAKRERPQAFAAGAINLGRGVAIKIQAPQLEKYRGELADAFRALLIPQDAAGWRPHVTIQNKVRPEEARALFNTMQQDFHPRPVEIVGLAAWWYRGGPWELISRHIFR